MIVFFVLPAFSEALIEVTRCSGFLDEVESLRHITRLKGISPCRSLASMLQEVTRIGTCYGARYLNSSGSQASTRQGALTPKGLSA